MKREFRSAVDWWYYVLVIAVPAAVLVPPFATPTPEDDTPGLIIGLLVAALPIWLLLTTRYTVDAESLLIRSGPFRWQIPLSSVTKIEPSRSLLSSPALSLDRLKISFGANQHILVSPSDRDGFIQALKGDAA